MTRTNITIAIAILLTTMLACGGSSTQKAALAPTHTPLPTFTATPVPPTPAPPTETPTPTLTPSPTPTETPAPPTPSPTPVPSDTPTATPIPPTSAPPSPTPPPPPTATPTSPPPTATPEPIIKYVLAASSREFNCDFTAIYGTVQDARNNGIPNVEVRALGIHETTGLDFTVRTDGQGRYEAMRIPLPELQVGHWAVMIMEDGREASERFHWQSTPVCQSDDLGHSQVLRIDWKLIE